MSPANRPLPPSPAFNAAVLNVRDALCAGGRTDQDVSALLHPLIDAAAADVDVVWRVAQAVTDTLVDVNETMRVFTALLITAERALPALPPDDARTHALTAAISHCRTLRPDTSRARG